MSPQWVPHTHVHNWVGGEDRINSMKWAGRETLYADKHWGAEGGSELCVHASELVLLWKKYGTNWSMLRLGVFLSKSSD